MKVEIDIESMHCEHCAVNLERFLQDQPGVDAATVDYDTGVGWVTAEEAIAVETLVETIDAMGYGATIQDKR